MGLKKYILYVLFFALGAQGFVFQLLTPAINPPPSDYEVGAILCNLWNQGEHLGWEVIQPYANRKPLLGYYDQDSSEVWNWQIRWARNYGIKFFLHCWYDTSPSDSLTVESANDAFPAIRQSSFANEISHALLWCVRPNGRNSNEVINTLYPYWEANHFSRDDYYSYDNGEARKLLVGIHNYSALIETMGSASAVSNCLATLRQMAVDDGYGGIWFICNNGHTTEAAIQEVKDCGFDASFSYIFGETPHDYASDAEVRALQMDRIQTKDAIFPDIPTMSMGWHKRPWHPEAFGSAWRLTPDGYEALAEDVKTFMDGHPANALNRKIALLGTWNEYGEGHYVCPTEQYGFGYLNAIRKVFTTGGSLPADSVPTAAQKAGYEKRLRKFAAYWKLDDGSGTNVVDSSGFGHHAVLGGGATWNAAGKRGGCLAFDGSTGHVLLSGSQPLDEPASGWMHELARVRTIMMWVKADSLSGTQVLFDEGGKFDGLCIRINNGLLEVANTFANVKRFIGASFPDDGDWHHMAFVRNGNTIGGQSQLELYIDGALVDASNDVIGNYINFHQEASALGARIDEDAFGNTGDGDYFSGKLDEVMITYTGMTGQQIRDILGISSPGLKFERGFAVASMPADNKEYTVDLKRTYENPVVVMGPATCTDASPCNVRVTGVASNAFTFMIDEWAGQDGVREKDETVDYLVMEAGTGTVDGVKFEAGIVPGVQSSISTVAYQQAYGSPPVVFCQLGSFNDSAPAVARIATNTAGGFEVSLQESEGDDGWHNPETVYYIAVERGVFELDGLLFSAGLTDATDRFRVKSIGGAFTNATVLACMQTRNDPDPATLRHSDLDVRDVVDGSLRLKVEEEQSADSEMEHGEESVGYLFIGRPSTSLLGYWPLDGGGSDESGMGNDAGLIGDAVYEAALNGYGVALDGNGDAVEIPDSDPLDGMPQLSVLCQVYLDSLPAAGTYYSIVSKGQAYRFIVNEDGGGHFIVATEDNGWYEAGLVASMPDGTLSTGQWYQLAGTCDGERTHMYVNAALTGTSASNVTGNVAENTDPLRLGGSAASSISYVDGMIDEVRLFRGALGTNEIAALRDQDCVSGRWKFDGSPVDFSKHRNPMVLMGDAGYARGYDREGLALIGDGHAEAPGTGSLDGMNCLTLSCRVYLNSLPTLGSNYLPVDKGGAYRFAINSYAGGHFAVATDSNTWYSAGTTAPLSGAKFEPGRWYHLVGVYDGTRTKIYLDGILSGTGEIDISGNIADTSDVVECGNTSPTGEFLDGIVDEVEIFDCALDDEGVRALYQSRYRE